ncbi:hypothetical protein ACIQ4I_05770 [Rummeliibacillus sp. NPDC094406]|uniref:hypothetical protein n=1 Tax=Rummeliibacillus sp. NPDC094406 TaxID=3364511 RepID=UPI0038275A25
MQIRPKRNLLSWMDSYVPEKDLYFFSTEQLNKGFDFTDVLLMPINEFYNHSTYGQVEYVNAYEYWNVKNANYVVIAQKEWIETISEEQRQFILKVQVQLERGLVIPISFVHQLDNIPTSFVINEHIVIQRTMWENLSQTCKEDILTTMIYEWWDKGEAVTSPEWLPEFLEPFANTFGHVQGANCLAAVVYALTKGKQPWFINEWIHQETFLGKLAHYHYKECLSDELQPEDLIVWVDENSIIQHAAYHLGEDLFFNKHGQTIFNPWKILSKEQLNKEWEHLKLVKYRKKS